MNYIIITNNPLVQQKYSEENDVILVEHYRDVLTTTRNYVHQGAKLLSHPQAGSIKPYETPYRTIVVSKAQGGLDFESLSYIESALERFISLSNSMGVRSYDESCLQDFQVIDQGLLHSALMSLERLGFFCINQSKQAIC